MQVKIYKKDPNVKTPRFETKGSVGFDLASNMDIEILAHEIALIPTGLVIEVPENFALILASRSSTPRKKGLTMPHGIGVIDQDYSGENDEIKIQVKNFLEKPVLIKKGDKIAQGIFLKTEIAEFQEVQKAPKPATRGGFGSTDTQIH
jgi:dUTP pyrophosphatase